ncbi:hypothetical protein D3C71_1475120 [compost metagenome]
MLLRVQRRQAAVVIETLIAMVLIPMVQYQRAVAALLGNFFVTWLFSGLHQPGWFSKKFLTQPHRTRSHGCFMLRPWRMPHAFTHLP